MALTAFFAMTPDHEITRIGKTWSPAFIFISKKVVNLSHDNIARMECIIIAHPIAIDY
jgi:hypothetical protein